VLLAAFQLLANERGGAQDLTAVAYGAGRSDPKYQDTVGLFANPLPIRTSLAGVRTFRDALARTRAACLETFDHELPFAEIRRAVPAPFDEAAGAAEVVATCELIDSPLLNQVGKAADVGYAEEHAAPNPDDDGPDLPVGMRWLFALTSAIDCVATVQYRRSEFSLEAVAELVEGFMQVLNRSVAQPDDTVALAER
jgi:non-ribosomal peptide synthetase component F